jgi:DHA2 family multidrug resistance protein
MMRQLGGSFGIAALTTLIHTRQGLHRNNLLVNVNQYNPAFAERFQAMIHSFVAKGYTLLDAQTAAYKAISGMVLKQTLLLTYLDAYWVSGMVMLCSIPLLFLQKFKKNAKVPVDVH